jgi:excisionase family DNA binding protein
MGVTDTEPEGVDRGKVRLVRAREAAEMLSICERTLWDLTKRGAIQAVRFGRSVRYAMSDLQRFVETNRREQ